MGEDWVWRERKSMRVYDVSHSVIPTRRKRVETGIRLRGALGGGTSVWPMI